jgi:hypothetical protein
VRVEFPDQAFPVSAIHSAEYAERVACGRRRMARSRVVIAGTVRNALAVLPLTIRRIERLGALFSDYRVVIYENDSTDGTSELLTAIAAVAPRMTIVSEVLGAPINPKTRCPRRGDRMAGYRNRYHQLVVRQFSDFAHIIVADMDLPGGWCDEGIANTFGHDDWDFVGSNGIIVQRARWRLNNQYHFDSWAFRRHGSYKPMESRVVNHFAWQRGEPLEPVYSCFGGLGVYRMEAFRSARYAGGDCEHVPFHKHMRESGFARQFLNPSQLVFYGRKPKRFDNVVRLCNNAWFAYTGRPAAA